jgi:hypothetical protein
MRFIVLHYCLTQREDTPFWRANKHHANIPTILQAQLALWKHRLPSLFDDRGGLQFFGHGSQLYVLAGMKFPFDSGTNQPPLRRPAAGGGTRSPARRVSPQEPRLDPGPHRVRALASFQRRPRSHLGAATRRGGE